MAADTDFKLGAYAGGTAGMLYVENITDEGGVEGGKYPLVDNWRNWQDMVVLGNGTRRPVGLPSCLWRFKALTKTQRTALKAYMPTGSDSVYIRTLKPDSTYATYNAVLTWVSEERPEGALDALIAQDVDIEVTFMVVQ